MNIFVYICVRTHKSVWKNSYTEVYVCLCESMYIYMYVCIAISVYVHMLVQSSVFMQVKTLRKCQMSMDAFLHFIFPFFTAIKKKLVCGSKDVNVSKKKKKINFNLYFLSPFFIEIFFKTSILKKIFKINQFSSIIKVGFGLEVISMFLFLSKQFQ